MFVSFRKHAYRAAALACCALLLAQPGFGQGRDRDAPPPNAIDQRTGEVLNEAIEFLNTDQYEQAAGVLGELRMDRLSPYEKGRVEQILSTIAYAQGDYAGARRHMQLALDSGGLNEVEMAQMRYQIAQMFMAEENWVEGARAMEEWIATAAAPNSAAYYLLSAAYYQMEDFERSLPHARKAVDVSDMPQETWLQLLQALLLQKEDYPAARDVLTRMVNLFPDKKVYWQQLSSVYATLEDYPNALAIMELALHQGLLNEGTDLRRLADLYMVQNQPYRAATLLEDTLERKLLTPELRLYEALANAWVAAREYREALPVLGQAAALSDNGDLYQRQGEVNVQLEEWAAAEQAFRHALDKGGLRDKAYVHLLLGIVLYNQEDFGEARRWLEEAADSESQERTARGYLQLIDSRNS